MVNLEPSWEALGHIVVRAIEDSNIPEGQKDGLTKMVEQMASIAHHARVQQLRQQLEVGEISSIPKWAWRDTSPECKLQEGVVDWSALRNRKLFRSSTQEVEETSLASE